MLSCLIVDIEELEIFVRKPYSNSQINICDQNRLNHRYIKVSTVVLVCLCISFALFTMIVITIGFVVQQDQISKFEQQLHDSPE